MRSGKIDPSILVGGRRNSTGTPLVRASRFCRDGLWLKLEGLMPSGSAFDRVAWPMLEERREELTQEGPAIVAGSGSQALAFASAARALRLPLVAVCPESTLPEHLDLLGQHRIDVVRTPGHGGYLGTHDAAVELQRRRGGTLLLTPRLAGRAAYHFERTLGQELVEMLATAGDLRPDVVVAPIGSGALLSGVALAFRSAGMPTEPIGTVLHDSERGLSSQDGVVTHADAPSIAGARFVPVSDREAAETRSALAKSEGILAGLGAAAAVVAGRRIAQEGRRAIVIVTDAGDRYFSVDERLRSMEESAS